MPPGPARPRSPPSPSADKAPAASRTPPPRPPAHPRRIHRQAYAGRNPRGSFPAASAARHSRCRDYRRRPYRASRRSAAATSHPARRYGRRRDHRDGRRAFLAFMLSGWRRSSAKALAAGVSAGGSSNDSRMHIIADHAAGAERDRWVVRPWPIACQPAICLELPSPTPPHKGTGRMSPMPETFDLLLRNGTVVNHDGVGVRDIGVRAGRIAALGDLAAQIAVARSSTPLASRSCPASSTRRCISASPAPSTRRTWKPARSRR